MADPNQVTTLASTMNANNAPQNQAIIYPGNAPQTSDTNTASIDTFLSGLKDQMSSLVSSNQSNTDLQDLFAKAIGNVQSGSDKQTQSLNLQYGGKEAVQQTKNQALMNSVQESQRGFATNTALLKQVQDSGTQAIKDLEEQKQMLILQGQAAAAGQIAGLQVSQAELQLKQRSELFNNLIGIAGVASQQGQLRLSQQQTKIAQDQALNDLQSKMGNIALQYGVKVAAGDTLSDVVNRAAGNAKALYDFQLQDAAASLKLKAAQTNLANAQAQTAAGKSVTDFDGFWDAVNIMPGGVGSQGGQGAMQALLSSMAQSPDSVMNFYKSYSKKTQPVERNDQQMLQMALYGKSQGQDFATFVGNIALNPSIPASQKVPGGRLEQIARNVYGQPTTPGMIPLYAQSWAEEPLTVAGNAITGATNPYKAFQQGLYK